MSSNKIKNHIQFYDFGMYRFQTPRSVAINSIGSQTFQNIMTRDEVIRNLQSAQFLLKALLVPRAQAAKGLCEKKFGEFEKFVESLYSA